MACRGEGVALYALQSALAQAYINYEKLANRGLYSSSTGNTPVSAQASYWTHYLFTLIFRRRWFDCRDVISSPSNIYLFCPEKIQWSPFCCLFPTKETMSLNTSWQLAIKLVNATLMAHVHMHIQSLFRRTVQWMASLCDIWKEILSSKWKMPPHPSTQTQRIRELFPINPSIPVAQLTCLLLHIVQ